MNQRDLSQSEVAAMATVERVDAFIGRLPSHLRSQAQALMDRHDYTSTDDGPTPYSNVHGHPLVQLPLWVDGAFGESLDVGVMSDILESSLCGYLSVRAEDDYFDGEWVEPRSAMMLADSFRARHHALLARHVSAESFWERSETVWVGYAEAMLIESELNSSSSEYVADDFDVVLGRSQPLEIPAGAVLSLKGRWEHAPQLSDLVRRLVKATQLFDDFVDAPEDLAMGNYTWMLRRLGGLSGPQALRRGMVERCDEVFAEVSAELDRAADLAGDLGLVELNELTEARRREMAGLSETMFNALFGDLNLPGPASTSTTA